MTTKSVQFAPVARASELEYQPVGVPRAELAEVKRGRPWGRAALKVTKKAVMALTWSGPSRVVQGVVGLCCWAGAFIYWGGYPTDPQKALIFLKIGVAILLPNIIDAIRLGLLSLYGWIKFELEYEVNKLERHK